MDLEANTSVFKSRLLLVHHLLPPEEAVPRALGVGVVEVHDLNNGRVALVPTDKVVVIELAVVLVHRDAGQVNLIHRLRPAKLVSGCW